MVKLGLANTKNDFMKTSWSQKCQLETRLLYQSPIENSLLNAQKDETSLWIQFPLQINIAHVNIIVS